MTNRFPITTAQQLTAYVRALRKSHGKTQADVGRMLGVSAMRVATIEKDVGRLSTKSLIALLQLFGARLELETEHDVTPPTTPRRDPKSQVKETPNLQRVSSKPSRGGEW